MKKILIITASFLFCTNAMAQNQALDDGIKKAQTQWEEAKYKLKEKSARLQKFEECANDAKKLSQNFENEAAPVIWQGICTASQAQILKLSALSKAKEAKAIFEKALKINDKALDGSAYMNLAVLYQRVPSWPIGFGDKKLAQENFEKAIAIAPKNIDINYFYALFLIDEDKEEEALKHLKITVNAKNRNRDFADSIRKKEAQELINEIQE